MLTVQATAVVTHLGPLGTRATPYPLSAWVNTPGFSAYPAEHERQVSRRRASKPTSRRHQAGSMAATRHHRCPAQLRMSCFPRPRRVLLGHGYDFSPGWPAPSRPVRARDYSRVDDGGRVDELRDRHPSPSHVPPSITCECLCVTHRSHRGLCHRKPDGRHMCSAGRSWEMGG